MVYPSIEKHGSSSLSRDQMVEQVISAVGKWEGVQRASHRFGAVEWRLGRVEIGHIHREGMLDIPFTVAIRDQLLAEGRTGPHHILPETGNTTFYLRDEADVPRAIWLVRVSYVHKAIRRLAGFDGAMALDALHPSAELRRLIAGHTLRNIDES
jgi:hypothetical protein